MVCPPVLFIIFNRPDLTQRVFARIREARPASLFIAADGPRPDYPGEKQICVVTRCVVDQVDWPCEVKVLFQEQNLGCKIAPSLAISWFFEKEKEGIILEDDCLPDSSFFSFCAELLERYRNESRVMMISGNYFAGEKHRPTESYYFSRYTQTWGWATWRRVWQYYDLQMMKWPQLKRTNFLSQLADGDKYFISYWSEIFDMAYAGKINAWDYQFIFACWVNHGLSILPSKNLVKNIGFGTDATHTFDDGCWIAKLPLQRIEFPLIHPISIERNIAVDSWYNRHVFSTPFISLLKTWVMQQPGGDVMAKMYRFFKKLLYRGNKL